MVRGGCYGKLALTSFTLEGAIMARYKSHVTAARRYWMHVDRAAALDATLDQQIEELRRTVRANIEREQKLAEIEADTYRTITGTDIPNDDIPNPAAEAEAAAERTSDADAE